MRKYISLFFIATLVLASTIRVKAQLQKGQITINAGVGYSPEFDGDIIFFGQEYCVPATIDNMEYPFFSCTSVVPNLGVTCDYALSSQSSIGLASSYQSEIVLWGQEGIQSSFSNKITRVNLAARFLMHLNKTHAWFDHYIGFRPGTSYWHDSPYPYTYTYYTSGGILTSTTQTNYFLRTHNYFVASFQLLYGMRIYFNDIMGFHFEAGIGSPYLFEAGFTYRLNTIKPQEASK